MSQRRQSLRATRPSAKAKISYAETDDSDAAQSSEASVSEYGEDDEGGQDEDEGEAETTEDPSEDEDSEEEFSPARKRRRKQNGSAASTPRGNARSKKARASQGGTTPTRNGAKVKRKQDSDEEDDDEEGDATLDSVGIGEVFSVTKFTPAPKDKHVKGQVGKPVIEFMTRLLDPRYNDRDWFRMNEKVWKWVKQDFDEFVGDFLETLMDDVDETVPYLPVKDMVYRIHRDVRFSNDKTPYKKTLMATFSRGGRKGPYAGYHICLRAGGQSALYAGLWEPPSEYLNTLRDHIKEETPELRQFKGIISSSPFVKAFGEAKPNPGKKITGSLWGRDELKSAPKGVDKSHPEIHLLRLKSYCVARRFTDGEVVRGDWKKKLIEAARVAQPFVEQVNEMIHPTPPRPGQ